MIANKKQNTIVFKLKLLYYLKGDESMKKKLDKDFIIWLSNKKNEDETMLNFRLQAFAKFQSLDNPTFGPKINLDFNNINYYKSDTNIPTDKWDEVSFDIKETFKTLGVIDAEEKYLDGVSNQYESEVVYHNNKTKKDIIFMSTDEALKKYPLWYFLYIP